MGCSNCKKKTTVIPKEETEKLKKPVVDIDKGATWFVIIWLLLGGYGLYSLIKDIISLI